jgi:hypothetical protein
MKKLLCLSVVSLIIFSCKKIERTTPPPVTPEVEQSIVFSTSIDTSSAQLNISDSLPLTISVSSKIPNSGVIYSISVLRVDSSINTFKVDSISVSPSFTLMIKGLKAQTSFTLSVKVTSKATSTNSASKNYTLVNNPIDRMSVILKSYPFEISIPNYPEPQYGLASIQHGNSGTLLYSVDGIEHIITTPGTKYPSPPLHFIKQPGADWSFEGYYWEGAMDLARNYAFMDERGTICYANTGTEAFTPWPLGDLYVVKTNNTKLAWTKLSNSKSFYHSVAAGDIDNDGVGDVVGLKFPGLTTGTWSNNALEPYLQKSNNQYIEQRTYINSNSQPDDFSGSSVLIANVMGDSRPEIIKGEYKGNLNNPSSRYGFAVYKYNTSTNRYEFAKSPSSLGVFKNMDQGSTSMKASDFNNDGFIDLAIATEGKPGNHIQIWNGNGQGDFTPGQLLLYTEDQVEFREFEVADFDKDGWLDIILHPTKNSKSLLFNPNGGNSPYGVILQNCLWRNNRGNFSFISKSLAAPGINPGFLRGFYVNGKIKFIGFESTPGNPANFNKFKLHEITITL